MSRPQSKIETIGTDVYHLKMAYRAMVGVIDSRAILDKQRMDRMQQEIDALKSEINALKKPEEQKDK